MADVDSASQQAQQEALGTLGNGDMADDEAAAKDQQQNDEDATKTDTAENGENEPASRSSPVGEEEQQQQNGSGEDEAGIQEGDKDDEKAKEADDNNNNNNNDLAAEATSNDDAKPSEDAAAPAADPAASNSEDAVPPEAGQTDASPESSSETKAEEGEVKEGGEETATNEGEQNEKDAQPAEAAAEGERRNEGETTGEEAGKQQQQEGQKQAEEGADPEADKDASAAAAAPPPPPQDAQREQADDAEEEEEENQQARAHQPPPTPTFDSDQERDEDDTARGQAAEALEKEAAEGPEDRDRADDTAGQAVISGIAAAAAAKAVDVAEGENEDAPGLLMSARTPLTTDGMIVTSTTVKRLTNTPLEGAGPPAKPRTSQLPPVARGQVRGQQMTSSISDALQYAGQPTPKMLIRSRRPPKYIRLATVTVSPARSRSLPQGPSLYYEEPKRPKKVITWEEANNARPPLRIDMEGPTACSYTPRVKPLNETNAPAFTFGTKCSPEKTGGARTSWSKSWFQTPHVWHTKVDFGRDNNWPSPNHYPKMSGIGPRQRTMPEAPSYTFGHKTAFSIVKPGAPKEPSPNEYKRQTADKIVLPQGPSFTHQLRREGTMLWGASEATPGPAAYTPSKPSPERPSFTIQGIRREKSHVLGPYSAL